MQRPAKPSRQVRFLSSPYSFLLLHCAHVADRPTRDGRRILLRILLNTLIRTLIHTLIHTLIRTIGTGRAQRIRHRSGHPARFLDAEPRVARIQLRTVAVADGAEGARLPVRPLKKASSGTALSKPDIVRASSPVPRAALIG
jgi:hypothetical protein